MTLTSVTLTVLILLVAINLICSLFFNRKNYIQDKEINFLSEQVKKNLETKSEFETSTSRKITELIESHQNLGRNTEQNIVSVKQAIKTLEEKKIGKGQIDQLLKSFAKIEEKISSLQITINNLNLRVFKEEYK